MASRVDLRFRDEDLFHRVPAPVRALIRSQGGPMAGMVLDSTNVAFDKVATAPVPHDLAP